MKKVLFAASLAGSIASRVFGITIAVDYTYDTNNFFSTPERKAALEAAAARYSNIITDSLLRVDSSYMGGSTDWRIGFTHPGNGNSFQISTARGAGNDTIVASGGASANVYNSAFVLPTDTWILFAGGRANLGTAGLGGSGTGTNLTSVFNDVNGPMHRGAIPNTSGSTSSNDLPAWGGSISFNSTLNWHFGLTTAAPTGTTDFYSIALHEIGHALGLSTEWNQWERTGRTYTGQAAVAAYNADNGTALASLNLVSNTDEHWVDNLYDSFIFPLGNPNLVGTVGLRTRQDLLMEPIANFGNPTPSRFELTNVDVAALFDLEWSVIPEPTSAMFVVIGICGVAFSRKCTARE